MMVTQPGLGGPRLREQYNRVTESSKYPDPVAALWRTMIANVGQDDYYEADESFRLGFGWIVLVMNRYGPSENEPVTLPGISKNRMRLQSM